MQGVSNKEIVMNVLSLFDGISCGRVALDRVGIKVDKYYAYEIESNAIKISKKNYPDIIHCGDVMTADFKQYEGIDLLMGGSPCQSLSIVQSKTRQNLDGKSKLFFEFVRALREAKPKYFLFENVASMNDESKRVISELLDCEPLLIDSANFSAQTRQRLYWTNIPVKLYKSNESILQDILEKHVAEKYFYDCEFDFLGLDKTVCAILHINGHDIIKRVNSPIAKCQTLTACSGGNHQKKVYDNGRCRKLTPIEYERLQTLPDNYTSGISDTARYTVIGNGWTVDVIAHILSSLNELVIIYQMNNLEPKIEFTNGKIAFLCDKKKDCSNSYNCKNDICNYTYDYEHYIYRKQEQCNESTDLKK